MAKLWIVGVTLDFEMAVVADSEAEAECIAEQNWREEPAADDILASARECTVLPHDFVGSIPYGGEGDATCETYLTGDES